VYADKLLRKQVESEQKRRRYVVYTILLLSILYVITTLLVGDRGLMRYLELGKKETALRAKVTELKQDNEKLRTALDSYGENNFYLEKHARENFGLAEKDEYIYLYEDE
jgi:cell division protein FtsB